MNGNERILAALSSGGCAETPAVVCYEGIFIRDHWSELTAWPWWYAQSPSLEHQVLWRTDVIRAVGQDWVALPSGYSREDRRHLRVEVQGESALLVDDRTGTHRLLTPPAVSGWAPGGGLHSNRPEQMPETEDQIAERLPPVPAPDLEQLSADGSFDLAQAIRNGPARDLFSMAYISSPLWGCYSLWGFEGMMIQVATRPDLVAYAGSLLLKRALHAVHRAAAMGAEGIWIEECYTDMIHPRAFEALNLPLVTRLVDEIRSCGMKSVYYYCGDPGTRWDLLFAAGADALSLEEGKKGFTIDIHEAARRADGRCALLGNLDAIGVLQDGTDRELEAEIGRQLEAGGRNGNRFIMSLGSPPTPGTPVSRVRRYCDLVRRLSS